MITTHQLQDFDKHSQKSSDLKIKIEEFTKVLNNNPGTIHQIEGIDLYDTKRLVEHIDIKAENVICTTYFTSKSDPQRNIIVDSDNIKYIEPWYNSVKKLNLFGIVFYDSLSSEFIEKYQVPNIRFVKCTLGNYSLNDERFIIYNMFFLKHKVKNILFTDGSDVTINKDPFPFIEQKPHNTIFIGRGQENKIYHSPWNLNSINKLTTNLNIELPNNFFEMSIYNAGIIGGSYYTTMFFLRQICTLFFKIDKGDNNNMAAMHYVLYHYFYPNCRRNFKSVIYDLTSKNLKLKIKDTLIKLRLGSLINTRISYENDTIAVSEYIYSGYPLNSKFNKLESESDAYIIHK